MQYVKGERNFPETVEPLSISADFIAPLPQGQFEVALHDYNTGAEVVTMRAELISNNSRVPTVCCVAMVRLAKPRPSPVLQPRAFHIPDRLRDCARFASALLYRVNPPTASVRPFTPRGAGFPLWSHEFGGQSTRWQWTKLDAEERFGLFHLPVVADLVRYGPFRATTARGAM